MRHDGTRMIAGASSRGSWLVEPLRIREEAHRRHVLLAIAALIILSAMPVFGHHLAAGGAALLAGRDHLLGVCLIAVHLLLAPVHTASHLLILSGLAYATWDRARAWRDVRRSLRGLPATVPASDSDLGAAAAAAGLPLHRLRIVPDLPTPAFTAGWLRPVVYVAESLAGMLTPDELAAVVAHERAHLVRRDPVRLSALRFLACTLFFLPALRRLAADAADEAEIAADDAAAGSSSHRAPLALASAIVISATHWAPTHHSGTLPAMGRRQGIVGFQHEDLLDRRVRRLVGEDAVVGTHVTRRSLSGAATALSIFWMSGLMMAHPLPADARGIVVSGESHGTHVADGEHGPGSHCVHHRVALSHLFCLGLHTARRAGAPCPHVGQ